jgi:hypothetical protein
MSLEARTRSTANSSLKLPLIIMVKSPSNHWISQDDCACDENEFNSSDVGPAHLLNHKDSINTMRLNETINSRTLGKTKRYCVDFHVNTARLVRVPSPLLPSWLHKEKGGETLSLVAFLLYQINRLPLAFIKVWTWRRGWCGFDSPGPAIGCDRSPVYRRNQTLSCAYFDRVIIRSKQCVFDRARSAGFQFGAQYNLRTISDSTTSAALVFDGELPAQIRVSRSFSRSD